MGFIRNNNVWKINKILAGISGGGVSPEDVQDMIDTSLTPIETAIEGKQDTLTAGDEIDIIENVIDLKQWKSIIASEHNNNYSFLIDENNYTKFDMIIMITGFSGIHYIPKHTNKSEIYLKFTRLTHIFSPIFIQLTTITVNNNNSLLGTFKGKTPFYESNGIISFYDGGDSGSYSAQYNNGYIYKSEVKIYIRGNENA